MWLPLLVLTWTAGINAAEDRVIRRDGPDVRGRVVSVDAEAIVVETDRGRQRLPRSAVAAIEFGEPEAPARPLKVELRNIRADDAIDVFLHDEPVLTNAREGGSWIDLSGRLQRGNNPLRLRIHNERAGWAYQLEIRINGVVTRLACGVPRRVDRPCRCCGKSGKELGTIEDLPVVWIHADPDRGRAEVLR